MKSIYVNWDDSKIKLTWKQDMMPPRELITSVHGFCFLYSKLLLVDLNHRGWDFPGGHIEVGETPEQCLLREAMEEGYVEGDCQLLGAVEVDHHENANWDESNPYPIVGYQVFYRMDITEMYAFEAKYESRRRKLINPKDVEKEKDWHEVYQAMLDYALTKNM